MHPLEYRSVITDVGHEMMNKTIIAVALVGLMGCRSHPINIPGSATSSLDPTGQFAIVWREAVSNSPHELWLAPSSSTNCTLILEFDRTVDILWSPHGSRVALTDWAGSNCSEIRIIAVAHPEQPIIVADLIPQEISSVARRNHHPLLRVNALEVRRRTGVSLVGIRLETRRNRFVCDESEA